MTIIATFMQTFAPEHNVGVFIAGRVIIGLGQGIALSMCSYFSLPLIMATTRVITNWHTHSFWANLHWRISPY